MKRTIIIFGNCQASFITHCLQNIPFFQQTFEVLWERNVDIPGWPTRKELLKSQIENCAYLFEQLGRHVIEFPHKDLLPADCTVIRYPYLILRCLWPLFETDPRDNPERGGQIPYGDRIVIDRLRKGIPKEQIFDEYMNMNIKDHVDIDQVYQSDMQRIMEVDDKCDVQVYDLISEFRVKNLFNTLNHPADNTIKLFLLRILEKARLIDRENDFQSIISDLENYFSQTRWDLVRVPIHPQICEHFGLTWADSESRYPYYEHGELSFREYMQFYINYVQPETKMAEKIKSLLEAENFEEANTILQQAIEKYPDSPDLLNAKGQFLLQTGDIEEATKIFLDLTERWPEHVESLNNLATICCFKQDWDIAIKLLRKALRLSPSDEDILANLTFAQNQVLLSKVLHFIEKGLLNEAQTILEGILNSDKENVDALNQLAVIQMKKGNLEEAEKKLSLVFKIDPTNEEATQNFIYLNQQRNR
jgi:Flp pilus assembly protein TadD